jgi:death on curing protein
MSREWAHLTPEIVRVIHRNVIKRYGGAEGIRDPALLESAVAAPQATIFGEPVLKSVEEVAAAYLFYLCKNHPFLDGNKRVALGACLFFLERNIMLYSAPLDTDAWEALVLDIAASRIDREQTTERLRALLKN